ncbi:MAG: DUF2934 domain-containing protein [Terriglobales bacterium]
MTHSCARTQFSRLRRDTGLGPAAVAAAPPSHEEIARLAYTYWEARGWVHGSAQEDWFRAERELLLRRSSALPSYPL